MKRKIVFLVCMFFIMMSSTYAYDVEWKTVDKSEISHTDYSMRVGDYFFKFESEYDQQKFKNVSYLLYSDNGNNYIKTNFQTATLPIYSDGLYFMFDTSMDNVPENKRVNGFNNSPSYIVDNDMQLIKEVNHNGYATYKGKYNGYHYITCKDYNNVKYDNGWSGNSTDIIYRTIDGNVLENVITTENLHFLNGFRLDNGDVFYVADDTKMHSLETVIGEHEIIHEKNNQISYQYISLQNPLLSINFVIGEDFYESNDGRENKQSIVKKYLSMDGIYGVEMPEDIGSYKFELNGELYFDKNEDFYYVISKLYLKDKIKVIYNDKILAFITPPTIESDRTLVPMRFLFEQMGADVEWEGETQTATVIKENERISFSINNREATVNNVSKIMDVPARLINDKTMIPIRFLSEELGYTVQWNEETKTVIIEE